MPGRKLNNDESSTLSEGKHALREAQLQRVNQEEQSRQKLKRAFKTCGTRAKTSFY